MPVPTSSAATQMQTGCNAFFQNARFPHSVTERELIETHISCVILTGDFAYKVKKPVDLGFVDYSSLERRKHFCDLEVELNRRFAPDIYLGVVPVFQSDGVVRFGTLDENDSTSAAEIADYAVKMKQFSQDAIVAMRLDHSQLTTDSVEEFGRFLAKFHSGIESADPNLPCIQPDQVMHDAFENFATLLDPLAGDSRHGILEPLEKWTTTQAFQLCDKFAKRLEQGEVKRCHGDLHLKNIIQVDRNLVAFDGIEFNERFQCVDVLSELAFPVMDFHARGRSDLGWRLLNAYLEATANYADLDVLRFYLVYRAMVRAKVAWLNSANHSESRRREYATAENPDDPFAGPWDKYLAVAYHFAFELNPKLSITHGFSGSGKSTVAMQVIDAEGGIRIRSDVLRHQLADQLSVTDKYSSAMNNRVYGCLAETARDGVNAGFPIVADATFLKTNSRVPFLALANELSVPFEIIDCDAPVEELCERLKNRTDDPSEANFEVLLQQVASCDPLSQDELPFTRVIRGGTTVKPYHNKNLPG